jgi:Lipocalin-like domain
MAPSLQTPASANPAPGLASAIVGASRLESTLQRLADGTTRPSPLYGSNGIGYLIYSASGHVTAMLADPGRERWSSEDEPTERDLRAIHDHFIAYCGRCEVNEQSGLVTHFLEMHVTPNFVGNVLVRRASLEGTQLTLRPLEEELPAGMLEYTLKWRRAEPAS